MVKLRTALFLASVLASAPVLGCNSPTDDDSSVDPFSIGPISDLPRGENSSGGPQSEGPVFVVDAGVATNIPPDLGGIIVADAGLPDYAPSGGRDASAEASVDDGTPLCVDAGVADQCGASLCRTTLSAVSKAPVAPASQCHEHASRRLACEGTIPLVAMQCAEKKALSLGFPMELRSCLREDPRVQEAEPECLDCYSSEVECAVSNCLVDCLSGGEGCLRCRAKHCGQQLALCTGLPVLWLVDRVLSSDP